MERAGLCPWTHVPSVECKIVSVKFELHPDSLPRPQPHAFETLELPDGSRDIACEVAHVQLAGAFLVEANAPLWAELSPTVARMVNARQLVLERRPLTGTPGFPAGLELRMLRLVWR